MRQMLTSWRISVLILVAAALTLSPGTKVLAHGSSAAGPDSGIRIPGLTHGQMAVLASYRREIQNLAARAIHTDEAFRRVMNYASIQFSFCLWGLMPGSIADENNPFNECSHGYLAATMALLQRMRAMPGPHPEVDVLATRIETDMVRNQTAMVLCRYSDEAFNTGRVIRPHWANVFSHPPSLAAFCGLAMLLAGGFLGVFRVTNGARPDVH
jgi:hypothetical protein